MALKHCYLKQVETWPGTFVFRIAIHTMPSLIPVQKKNVGFSISRRCHKNRPLADLIASEAAVIWSGTQNEKESVQMTGKDCAASLSAQRERLCSSPSLVLYIGSPDWNSTSVVHEISPGLSGKVTLCHYFPCYAALIWIWCFFKEEIRWWSTACCCSFIWSHK